MDPKKGRSVTLVAAKEGCCFNPITQRPSDEGFAKIMALQVPVVVRTRDLYEPRFTRSQNLQESRICENPGIASHGSAHKGRHASMLNN